MNYVVYGLRLKDDREVRYIGLTYRGTKHRLRTHIYQAIGLQMGTPLGLWITNNRENLEIFEIATASDSTTARRLEKDLIALGARLGQRLLNRLHVPPQLVAEPLDEAA